MVISRKQPFASSSAATTTPSPLVVQGKRISRIVFIALLLDILSFTIILPLLPRSLEAYKTRESNENTTLLRWILDNISLLRQLILANAPKSRFLQQGTRADLVLLGGLLGSVYSLLQCLVAPVIGRAADRYGRRSTLMFCMAGNIIWTVIWVFSSSFEGFLVARIIAGLSEGNVQISTTIIADVTEPGSRSHGMALVGIAFAVGFTLGPSIGAYFSRMNLDTLSPVGFAPFATAAMFSLALLLTESLYLYFKLPETLDFRTPKKPLADSSDTLVDSQSDEETRPKQPCGISTRTARVLRRLNLVHFAYLFFFSGMEYTLTFLTHDKFDFTNLQQGRLLGFIGIASTLLQGGYVRRVKGKSAHRDKSLVAQGMLGCTIGLLSIAFCCIAHDKSVDKPDARATKPSMWLWIGALGFAMASATVVNCLNSMVSLAGIADRDTGRRLGDFRSAGQIGRALGPMFACSLYWLSGATTCYLVGAGAVCAITLIFVALVPADTSLLKRQQKQE